MTDEQLEIIRKSIYACETGGQIYGQVKYDCYVGKNTNSSKETACTIGGAGNHADTAKTLMQLILNKYPSVFRKYDTAEIESDLKNSWEHYDPGIGSQKAKCIQQIIGTSEGIKCQDELLNSQIESRCEKVSKLGVADLDAQFFCAEIIHLGGFSAIERILQKTQEPYTIDNIFDALKTDQQDGSSDNQVGDSKYWSRHEKIYTWLKSKIPGGNTMGTLNGLLKRAEAEIGYIEKSSNINLDSKTANKGLNNYTKYSRDINSWGLAGCQGQPWCSTFQFWLEVQEFGLATALLHWHMSKSNYCGYGVFSTKDKFPVGKRSKTPKLGCLVVFSTSHIGRVVGINGNTITTIEGNTSPKSYDRNGGQVARKTYSINDSKINCFLIIDYNEYSNSSTTPSGGSTSISMNLKKGDSGSSVKTLQTNLIKLGFSCGTSGADGEFGSGTESAVKKFQKKYSLSVDGIVGKNTLSKIEELIKLQNAPTTQNFKSLYVETGAKGMLVGTDLKLRKKPVNGAENDILKKGTYIRPTERTVAGAFPTWWFKVNGYWCSGKYLTGWVLDKTAGKWWYLENGSYPASSWKKIDGVWYYFMGDGYMASYAYIKYNDHYCWVDNSGAWIEKYDTKNPDLNKYKLVK